MIISWCVLSVAITHVHASVACEDRPLFFGTLSFNGLKFTIFIGFSAIQHVNYSHSQ